MTDLFIPLRRRHALALGAASLAAPGFVRAAGKPVLRAGDQKAGLRALLESAGELKNLDYEIDQRSGGGASSCERGSAGIKRGRVIGDGHGRRTGYCLGIRRRFCCRAGRKQPPVRGVAHHAG